MNWINIKEECPPVSDLRKPFVLAYHTIFGVGTAWFFSAREYEIENWEKEGLKYICSCDFIQSIENDGGCPEVEEWIDIFESSPEFSNIGTITHWMKLPEPPYQKISYKPKVEMNWINVKDRLPEKGQRCLIIKKYKTDDTCPIIDTKTYFSGYKNIFNIRDFEVLYWCPIPDCPKELENRKMCILD